MTRRLVVLVFAPFLAWYVYRAVRAFRTGVIDTLGAASRAPRSPSDFGPPSGAWSSGA